LFWMKELEKSWKWKMGDANRDSEHVYGGHVAPQAFQRKWKLRNFSDVPILKPFSFFLFFLSIYMIRDGG
jgi:hypothetical protein